MWIQFQGRGEAKSFPWFSLWHNEGRQSSWETLTAGNLLSLQQTPDVPFSLFLSSSFPLSLFSFTISTFLPSVDKKKNVKAVFQLWNGCFRQLLLSLSPAYARCSQSCVKMSEQNYANDISKSGSWGSVIFICHYLEMFWHLHFVCMSTGFMISKTINWYYLIIIKEPEPKN